MDKLYVQLENEPPHAPTVEEVEGMVQVANAKLEARDIFLRCRLEINLVDIHVATTHRAGSI